MSPHPYRDPPAFPPRAVERSPSWPRRLADLGAWAAFHVVPFLIVMVCTMLLVWTPILEALVALDLFLASAIFLLVLLLVGLIALVAIVACVVILLRAFVALLRGRA